MDPDRWQKLEDLFQTAVEFEPGARAAFIAENCAADDDLRRELELMLVHHQQAGEFIESPAFAVEAESILDSDHSEDLVGQSFGQYQIVRVLGRGGMGIVYLAFDEVLHRHVALKFLQEDITCDPSRVVRFRQEARAASALNHPNILTIFEFGDKNNRQFTVTEFVEGETLRQRILRNSITLDEALDVGVQIASALSAAHNAGIVHRDIKPENIMLRPDGFIKVLDFGLAKLTESPLRDLESSTQVNTSPGMIIGTVQYMSPEQLRGADVDARADIWSLAVILYEMLAGATPFASDTPSDMIALILQAKPSFNWRNPNSPLELDWILKKALAKDREERYQSIRELQIDLKRVARDLGTEILSGPLSLAGTDTSSRDAQVSGVSGKITSESKTTRTGNTSAAGQHPVTSVRRRSSKRISSLAILPFVNLSGDPGAEYLSDGITESIINNLAQLPKLRVMARSTVFRYKGRDTDPQEIGHELGVHAVLTGRVLQMKDSLIIGTELVRTSDGSQLWGQHFNRQHGDIFVVQEEIASRISEKLQMQSSSEEKKRLARRHTQSAEAYQLYLKGRYFWNKRTPDGFQKAINWFDQATKIDPDYALAQSGLADSSTLLNFYSATPPQVTMTNASTAVAKAIKADESLAEVHSSAALVAFWYDWDWLRAKIEFERAIKLNPGYASAREFYGWYLVAMGEFQRAIEEGKKAIELDPLEPAVNLALGKSYYFAHKYDKAIELCQRALSLDAHFVPARFFLGQAYLQKKMFAKALAEFESGVSVLGQSSLGTAVIARAKALAGDKAAAEQGLQQLLDAVEAGAPYVPAFGIAMAYAGLGNTEQALNWLERARDERSLWIVYLNVDPVFDSLRGELRFKNLLAQLNFPHT